GMMTTSSDKGVLQQAQDRIERVLELSPFDPDALNALAIANLRMGKSAEAEELLQEAFAHAPQNQMSSLNLAKLKLSKNDPAGAEEILKKMVDTNPGKAEPLVVLAAFYSTRRQFEKAQQQFHHALQLDPNNGLALVSLASLEASGGRLDEAGKLYKQ